MAGRAPGALGELASALGDATADPEAAAGAVARLSGRCGHVRLATLGVTDDHLPGAAAAVKSHPALANTPDPPAEDELLALMRDAL